MKTRMPKKLTILIAALVVLARPWSLSRHPLRKIEYELRTARQEYENQIRQAEQEATENARKFGASKEFNYALKDK